MRTFWDIFMLITWVFCLIIAAYIIFYVIFVETDLAAKCYKWFKIKTKDTKKYKWSKLTQYDSTN